MSGDKETSVDIDHVLTQRQRAVYDWMLAYFAEHQRPPTFREIGVEFGIVSPNGVACNIKALARKGFIRIQPGARGVVFTRVRFVAKEV